MSTRRYRMLSALVAAALTAAALAGCGASVRTGTAPQAGAGSSSATVASGTGPVSPSPAGGAPGASGTPGGGGAGGGGATPGPGRTGDGAGTAKPAPLSSLTCGAATTVPGRLPDRDWTEAASCPVDAPRPGDGGPVNQPGVPIVKRGDLAPLVRALSQPDAPRTHGICPDYRVLMPTFWLVDSTGQAYQPHVPVNSCGQPSAAVLSALRALGLN